MIDAEPMVDARNLRVRYRNGAQGIGDISLKVYPGSVTGLFGANGAGKTTTVRAISGFLKTEGARIVSGSVSVLGVDTTNAEPHLQAKQGVFLVPERDKVFPTLSVGENLLTLGRLPGRRRRGELEAVIFELFPILKESVRRPAGRLSGGQRQMLAIARGIMSDPRLLIVDELTLGLHHSLQPLLFDALKSIARGGTAILIVDESVGFALKLVDYCYLISSGCIRDEGPAARFQGNELLAAGYVEPATAP